VHILLEGVPRGLSVSDVADTSAGWMVLITSPSEYLTVCSHILALSSMWNIHQDRRSQAQSDPCHRARTAGISTTSPTPPFSVNCIDVKWSDHKRTESMDMARASPTLTNNQASQLHYAARRHKTDITYFTETR
jgi:heme/copper-type cytochrome/quinol oxidase subunit 1